MLRSLQRFILIANHEAGSTQVLKEIFFRSNFLSNSELVQTCKRISMMNINDIRVGIGKEDYLKNFINSLILKSSHMETSDMISILRDLIKNPDFRDTRNTFSLWPTLCRNLISRVDGISANELTDILNSLCFIRISNVIFDNLLDSLKRRLVQMEVKDFLALPLSKFATLLWSLNQQRINLPSIYSIICQGLINHADFEYLSYEQMSMIMHFFYINKLVPNPDLLVRPLIENIKSALEEDKIKSIYELTDVIYFFSQIPSLPEKIHEIMSKLLLVRKQDFHSVVTLCRVISSSLKFSDELKAVLRTKIIENLNNLTISEIISVYKSSVLEKASEEKLKILNHIRKSKREISFISFSKMEKVLNDMYYLEYSDLKDIFLVMEDSFYEISTNKNVSDSFLLRVMRLIMKIKVKSCITKLFMTKISSKTSLPFYHTRNLVNLAIIISTIEELQTKQMIDLINHKTFNFCHLFDYFDLAIVFYFLSRINRIGIETQELFCKRLVDKDLNFTDIDSFSSVLVSTVMNNSTDYSRRNLPIVKALMSFKNISDSQLKLGNVMKKMINDFDISLLSLIRCLWILAYLDIKDARIINSALFSKLKDVLPDPSIAKEKIALDEKKMDSFHLTILVQSLGILGKDYQDAQEYSEKIVKILENSNPCFDKESPAVDDVENVCRSLDLLVERNKPLFGNSIPLCVNGVPVVVYNEEHYRYQSYLEEGRNQSDLQGFFLMRKKFWESVGVKFFEIESSEWNVLNSDQKIEFINKTFS